MNVSRRGFLSALTVGGVLSLGFEVGCGGAQTRIIRRADRTGDFSPNMYVTIRRDGRVGLEIDKAEIGQGAMTLFATLVAEELDVPIDAIDVHVADSAPEFRTYLGMQLTGGSNSTTGAYLPVRTASATAREMLVNAAARAWGVSPAECKTDAGYVVHGASNRKFGYGELTTRAARESVPSAPRLKSRSQFNVIGKRDRRVDLRAKVDGSAKFGMDVVVPNMVRAHVIHGPVYGAQALSVQADAARARPGVIDVFPFPGGVAIVAEKYWQARAAAEDVKVTWSAGDAAGLDTEKLRNAVRVHPDKGDVDRDDGNADKAIAGAALKVEAIYEGPFLAHAPMEPLNCTVHVREDKVEVWASCQSPTILQMLVSSALGVGLDDVLVHTTFVGGGFGRRIIPDFAVQAAFIARRVKRPVQMIWSRESDITQGYYRPQLCARVRAGMSAERKVTGMSGQVLGQSILLDAAPMLRGPLSVMPEPLQSMMANALRGLIASSTYPDVTTTQGLSDTPYELENVKVTLTPVHTKIPVAFFRSVGHSFNTFAMESLVDELAHASKVDPIALRRQMLPQNSRSRRVLDAVAALAKWDPRGGQGIGRGVARAEAFGTEVAQIAEVEIVNGRIKVRRVFAAVECGVVVNPDVVRAQIEGAIIFGLSAALDQEITLVDGVVQQRNFDNYPVLRMHECPEITVKILESDANPTGIGEPGVPPVAPAVANAIFDLTGVRLRRLPLQRAWNEVRR